MKDCTVIIVGAGKGLRAGFDKNKLLVPINGKTVIESTINAFSVCNYIKHYIVAVSKEDYEEMKTILPDFVKIVIGGKTRTESVKNALNFCEDEIVLIHDGARPFVSKKVIEDCIACAEKFGSAIPVIDTRDTLCKIKDGLVSEYVGKSGYANIQTPQAFITSEIKKAYELSPIDAFNDDGEVYAKYIKPLRFVEGDIKNIKLTFKEDFENAKEIRYGVGFDCHKLVENRKLILGGIEIKHDKGLLGHSDADVLTHAIMDAILSACAMRDIGFWFPDNDIKYKDANSITLLKEVLKIVGEKGYTVKSVSAVMMAEKPKLLHHIPTITENLAKTLGIEKEKVGISATTLEGLGFVGREEGICVHANVTVK